jgi:DNA polymerase zeta
LPGIRGSQYKVEGVLLRALQSVASDERGQKKGRNKSHLSGPSSSLSGHSDSQNPSPWKLRRNFTQHLAGRKNRDVLGECSNSKENESPYLSSRGGLENRGFFFFSLGKEEKDQLEPLRVQALTLEPLSGFYKDPVVVCDFTALYPSLVIAYNLCYSTCAGQVDYTSLRQETVGRGMTTGRVGPFRYPEQLTATILKQHVKSLSKSKNGIKRIADDRAYVAPNGAIFVGESVLRGVLPQVLSEILMTRAMIKRAAKIYKARGVELSVLRQLEARQLALKYVANVTYGYTSATFSGRSAMPVLADAIVECARRTLTNAIRLAEKWGKEQGGKWEGAEVIYGDTDSIFVKLPGRTVEESFIFGKEFCEEVTFSNPPPVELKLEKVYKGTLLQTKKRYCGMKFEAPHQEPELESKGIETIRKDQCHLTQKILSQALITVFKQGKEALKDLLERQWANIYAGKLPVSDFILTGRVRDKYRKGADKSPPAAAALVRRLAQSDPGLVIRDKERVSYVVVASPGRSIRLSDCVVTPLELLEQWDSYRINVAYYITKHLNAALHRCFSLPPYSIDVHKWYEACPKPRKRIQYWPASSAGATSMITSYFGSDVCTLCNRKCKMVGNSRLVVICKSCRKNKQWTTLYTLERCGQAQRRAHELAKICKACTGCPETGDSFAVEVVTRLGKMARTVATPLANCVCTDCPITYERHRAKEELIFSDELCKALDLSW